MKRYNNKPFLFFFVLDFDTLAVYRAFLFANTNVLNIYFNRQLIWRKTNVEIEDKLIENCVSDINNINKTIKRTSKNCFF